MPKRLEGTAPGQMKWVFRGAVCGVCALALAVGTLKFHPGLLTSGGEEEQEGIPVLTPAFSFGLTAYAAGSDTAYGPGANGTIAFTAGEGMANPGEGNYTGSLFQVTGEGIQTLTLSIDRGGLYRYQLHTDLTDEEMSQYRERMGRGEMATAAISQTDGGVWYMPEMTALGNSVTEPYQPEVRYGFWVPPEQMSYQTGLGMSEEAERDMDLFDGAALTVQAVFEDGSEQTKTYTLSTGKLRVAQNILGGLELLPQLAGDDEAYVYGIYAASDSESRWLQWPLEEFKTVSLSNAFGQCVQSGGEGVSMHNGIDIAAANGTAIMAALDGTVAETGLDAERGNYVILDHGGGLRTVYAACDEIQVSRGDTVQAGSVIATVGSTGASTGPHLCFQVWQDGVAQNPVAYFEASIRATLRAE